MEIGCGRGVAVPLVCERLTTGKITAIDRSAKMIAAAQQQNRDYVAGGKAEFRTVEFETAKFDDERFDKIFAVNVNMFWLRPISRELDLVRSLLKPRGALYLSYEPPGARAAELISKLVAGLAPNGFTTATLTSTSAAGAAMLCIVARPA
jgi:trans-aconitate methyltransferase